MERTFCQHCKGILTNLMEEKQGFHQACEDLIRVYKKKYLEKRFSFKINDSGEIEIGFRVGLVGEVFNHLIHFFRL